MFKFPFALALMFTTLAGASIENCESTQKFVIVHGIGGSQNSFGYMKEALEENIPCSKAYYYNYQTENSELRVEDFAKGLDSFISNIPEKTDAKDLNLIMHSQGGLVGITWVINSFHQNQGYTLANLNKLNRFITLSTPFWGSDFALLGSKFFYSLSIEDNAISPFGKRQLNDMKYGSAMLRSLNNTIMRDLELRSFLESRVNILNISGQTPYVDKGFSTMATQFIEGDLIVNIPSMKLSLLDAYTSKEYAENIREVAVAEKKSLGRQTYVHGTHIPALFGEGVVDVPKECIRRERCQHQGIKAIFDFIGTNTISKSEEIETTIKGFDLHVKVRIPEGMDPSQVRLTSSRNEQDISISNYRFTGQYHHPVNIDENTAYFVIKGSIMWDSHNADVAVNITHPDALARGLEVVVEKGSITFLDTSLKRRN